MTLARRGWLASLIALLLITAACGSRVDAPDGVAVDAGSDPKATDGSDTPSGTTGDGSGSAPNDDATAENNGGATDVGVTADSIKIGIQADVTGPRPGLFKTAVEGIDAYAAYVNDSGGVNGRMIEVVPLDTKLNGDEVRRTAKEACDSLFALVGSMSIQDGDAAATIEECGIPDISGTALTLERQSVPTNYSPLPQAPGFWTTGPGAYLKTQFPDAISNAAMITVDQASPKLNAAKLVEAYTQEGFTFVYEGLTNVVQIDFTKIILDMKDKGVQYVMMIADNAQMADFLKAMKTQGFEPQVIEFMPQAYSQSFVDLGGAAVDGSYVWANFALIEEADANPQMALYQEWLEKTHPGATPDIFGVYAWGAGMMFVEALRNSGPEATRAGVLKSLSEDFIDWNADGFMGTSSPSTRTPSRCFALMQVQDGKFVRVYPEEPGAFECELGALREVQPNL